MAESSEIGRPAETSLCLPAGGESRARHPALQGLRERNEHQHGSQHPALRCVLRDRRQRHGGQGKALLLLRCVSCAYSVVTVWWFAQDACQILHRRLEPIRTKNPDGSWESWVRTGLTDAAPLLLVTLLLLGSQISKAHSDKVSLSATGFFRWDGRQAPPTGRSRRRCDGVCPQGSGPLHGLGEDGGPALRLLHLRSLLL